MTRRTFGAAAAGLALLAAALGGPSAAPVSAATPPPPEFQTRIVGGTTSIASAWPWQAALLDRRYADTYDAMFCGASVIGPSWVLTAAHCVFDPDTGARIGPSRLDVLTGTTVLGDGSGSRLTVSAVHVHPGYNAWTSANDLAVLRLTKPTTAAPITLVTPAQGALWAAGTDAVITGWGNTEMDAFDHPDRLREATVPIQSDATCAADYPPGRDPSTGQPVESFSAATMLCAGPQEGGRDTCQGDSGGPLVVPGPSASGWVQAGITSWGNGCALPGYPGVYSRLGAPALADFVTATKRFTPFDDAFAFIVWQYVDFNHRFPTADEVDHWTARLATEPPRTLTTTLARGTTWQQQGQAVARLYRATFLRDPDSGGMTYWLDRVRTGTPLTSVAASFAASSEFSQRYGTLSNGGFVDLVYRNVLGRAPDPGGRSYWVGRLGSGLSRGGMMIGFSESSEYRTATSARIEAITVFYAMLRRMPTDIETTAILAAPIGSVIDDLRSTYSYAARF